MPDAHATARRAAALAVAALFIGLSAGCASTPAARGAEHPPSPPRPTAAAAQRPVAGDRSTAATCARQIAGCHPGPLTPRTAAPRLHLPAAPTDTSERVGQQSVVRDVALVLVGLVETGGD